MCCHSGSHSPAAFGDFAHTDRAASLNTKDRPLTKESAPKFRECPTLSHPPPTSSRRLRNAQKLNDFRQQYSRNKLCKRTSSKPQQKHRNDQPTGSPARRTNHHHAQQRGTTNPALPRTAEAHLTQRAPQSGAPVTNNLHAADHASNIGINHGQHISQQARQHSSRSLHSRSSLGGHPHVHGSTDESGSESQSAEHPRVRGEHDMDCHQRFQIQGSSPRAWGAPPPPWSVRRHWRIIPACVGSTSRRSRR